MKYQLREEGVPVLLLHGFLEEGNMWNNLIKGIEGCQFILPDLPGHGASFEEENEMTMESLAEAVFALLDKLKINSVHVVGHSMGAYIAMEMIRKAPERIHSMLFFQSTSTADPVAVLAKRDRAMKAVMSNKSRYIKTMINGLFAPETKDQFQEDIDALIAAALHLNATSIAKVILGMKERKDAVQLISNFEKPKGYYLGAKDPVLSVRRMQKELQQVEPDSYFMHPTMGHMAHIEAPQSANVFLKMWLESNVQS